MSNHDLNHQCLCGCHNDLRLSEYCENCGEKLTNDNNRTKAIVLNNYKKDGSMAKTKIYIAGKITGEDKLKCVTKFQHAEIKLKKEYDVVYNPMKLVTNYNTPWRRAMLICLRVIINDLPDLYFLKDWQESEGAGVEMQVAKSLGLKIYFENTVEL